MKVKLQEDIRTLRDFYPDPILRHQVHYAFAHRFLPQYVQQNPYAFFSYLYHQDSSGGEMGPTRFIHSRWSAIFEAGLTAHKLGGYASALIEMPVAIFHRLVSAFAVVIPEVAGQVRHQRRLAVFRVFCWDFPVTMIIVTAVFGVLRPFLQ
jgi:hypothetical protein